MLNLLFVVVTGVIVCYPIFLNIVKNILATYLTVNKPVSTAQVLIVEGWLFDCFLPDVKNEFILGSYRYILVSYGNDAVERDDGFSIQTGYAREHFMHNLHSLGLDASVLKIVVVQKPTKHNTLAMALAAKQWFSENDPGVSRVNICSAGSHGRKSVVAYKRALGKCFAVGIFSYYRKKIPVFLWWKESKEGLRWLLLRWIGAIDAAWCPFSWV
jgi:hypothetical protein